MAFVLLAAFIVIGLLFALTSGSDVTSNEVKIPEGIPTTNKVNGQKRMLAEKRSTVKWY